MMILTMSAQSQNGQHGEIFLHIVTHVGDWEEPYGATPFSLSEQAL